MCFFIKFSFLISFLSQQINDMNLCPSSLAWIEFSRQIYATAPFLSTTVIKTLSPSHWINFDKHFTRDHRCQKKALFHSCSSITRGKNARTTESWFSRLVGIEHAEQDAACIFQQRSFSKGTPLEYSSTDSWSPARHTLVLWTYTRDAREITSAFFFWHSSRGVVFHRGTQVVRGSRSTREETRGQERREKRLNFGQEFLAGNCSSKGICKEKKKKKEKTDEARCPDEDY